MLFAFLNKACLRLKKISGLLEPNLIISLAIITYLNILMFKLLKQANLLGIKILFLKDNERIQNSASLRDTFIYYYLLITTILGLERCAGLIFMDKSS